MSSDDSPDPYRVRADGIDADMKRCSWVCWQLEGEGDDSTKVPKRASNPRRNAKSNDATTWEPFEDALSTAEGRELGVGFPLAQATPFMAVDIDCPNGDEWVPDLDRLGGAVIERSPSENLRLYLRNVEKPEWWSNVGEHGDETEEVAVFEDAGYVTVTGDTLDGHGPPIGETSQVAFTTWLKEAWRAFADDDEPEPWNESETASGEADSGPQSRGKDGGNHSAPGSSNPNLGIYDVISRSEYPPGKRTTHPFHGSSTGSNFKVDDDGEAWRCFSAEHDTGGYAISLVGMEAGLMDCSDNFKDLTKAEQKEVYDEARERGYIADESPSDDGGSSEGAAADGGTAAASADGGGPAGDETDGEGDTDGDSTPDVSNPDALTPFAFKAEAGLGEDDSIADLGDRPKAAAVWELIERNDDVHVRVRRDNASLWAYDGGIWKREGERALRHAGRQALGARNYGPKILTKLKAQARSDLRAEVEPDGFGVRTGMLAVKNGLVDLKAAASGAGEDARRDLRPDDYALAQLPVEYDASAEYDEWAAYVEEWAEEGKADALQEYVGYCLHIGALPIHRAVLLVGQGSNGKGTFLHVVRELLGGDNTSSIELQTLANEKDAVADFYGSLANIDDDLSARKLGQGKGMFKKLIAGDRVRARNLYESGFEYDAVGKHLYAANKVPKVDVPDDDEAFWRRWLLVEFPNFYPPTERDTELRDELANDDETMSGVLNWAIEGRQRLLDQGYFTNEEQLAHDKRRRWQSWGDSTDEFISECVERDEDAPRMTTSEAHARYVAWCAEQEDTEAMKQQPFTVRLKAENVGYGKHRIDGKVQRGYTALGLSDDVPEASDDDDPDDSTQERL